MLGQVLWFDDTSGEGVISLEDGSSAYMHWSAIKGGDESEREVFGRLKTWTTVKAGYIGDVELVSDWNWRQVNIFKVTERAKPKKALSHFIDRDKMKMRLAVCKAEFDELFPDDKGVTEKFFDLKRKIKPTKKDLKALPLLESAYEEHNRQVKAWNEDKSRVIVAIYREHSRFYINKK